jgi:molybdopterin molybdotransferase
MEVPFNGGEGLMISIDRAIQIVLENTPVLDTVKVPIIQSRNMCLAEDIIASSDIPPYDMATSDGFAVRSEDIIKAISTSPVVLKFAGEVKVGSLWPEQLQPGYTAKISSGAPLPAGANTIVQSEHAVRENAQRVKIYQYEKPGENIFYKGNDIQAGMVVFPKGKNLAGADIGILGSLGRKEVICTRKPRVSFFASGNDLIRPELPVQDGKMHNGNLYFLECKLSDYGAEPINLGIIGADCSEVKEHIIKAISADMFITCAGSSLEDFDFVKGMLQKAGMDLKFWRVAIKPGKPLIFGTFNKIPVFGLPGNCLSAMVILEELVRPAVFKMQGRKEFRHTEVMARLEKEVKGGGNITHYIRAEVRLLDDGFVVSPTGSRNSPSVMALTSVNGFIIIPQDINQYCAGEMARVMVLPNQNQRGPI